MVYETLTPLGPSSASSTLGWTVRSAPRSVDVMPSLMVMLGAWFSPSRNKHPDDASSGTSAQPFMRGHSSKRRATRDRCGFVGGRDAIATSLSRFVARQRRCVDERAARGGNVEPARLDLGARLVHGDAA